MGERDNTLSPADSFGHDLSSLIRKFLITQLLGLHVH